MLILPASLPAYSVSWSSPVVQYASTELPALPPRFKEAFQETVSAESLIQVQNQTTLAAALDVIAQSIHICMIV